MTVLCLVSYPSEPEWEESSFLSIEEVLKNLRDAGIDSERIAATLKSLHDRKDVELDVWEPSQHYGLRLRVVDD